MLDLRKRKEECHFPDVPASVLSWPIRKLKIMITRLARDRAAKLAKVIRVGNIKTTDQPLESFDFNGRAAAI